MWVLLLGIGSLSCFQSLSWAEPPASLAKQSHDSTSHPKRVSACLGIAQPEIREEDMTKLRSSPRSDRNVLGTTLLTCGCEPMTGFERDGFCHTGPSDRGRHVVCAVMTDKFLTFTQRRGNDLSTPRPEFGFPGLKPGDHWCLCALRWAEAEQAGYAPPVILSATHESALKLVSLEQLKRAAVSKE